MWRASGHGHRQVQAVVARSVIIAAPQWRNLASATSFGRFRMLDSQDSQRSSAGENIRSNKSGPIADDIFAHLAEPLIQQHPKSQTGAARYHDKKHAQQLWRLVKSRKVQDAEDYLLQTIPVPTSEMYFSVLCGWARQGIAHRAVALLKKMKRNEAPVTVEVTNAVLTACARSFDAELAWRVWYAMKEDKLRPDRVTYSMMMRVVDWQDSLELWNEMPKVGIARDSLALHSLLRCLGRCRRWKEALNVFNSVADTIDLTFTLYNVLLSALAKSGRTDEVLDILAEMQDKGLAADTVTYNIALGVCKQTGDVALARRFLEEMNRHELPRDHITYAIAIASCVPSADYEQALKWLDEVKYTAMTPSTEILEAAVETVCAAKQWKKAEEVASQLRGVRLSGRMLLLACTIHAALGEWYNVTGLVRGAIDGAIVCTREATSHENLSRIVALCKEHGQEECVEKIERMLAPSSVQCYRCKDRGHSADRCPQKRAPGLSTLHEGLNLRPEKTDYQMRKEQRLRGEREARRGKGKDKT